MNTNERNSADVPGVIHVWSSELLEEADDTNERKVNINDNNKIVLSLSLQDNGQVPSCILRWSLHTAQTA